MTSPPRSDTLGQSASAAITVLRELEPRPSAMLVHRLVEGWTPGACATHYGISPEAFSVLLLRAGMLLARQWGRALQEPSNEDEEAAWARMLTKALERQDVKLPPALVPVVEACRELQAMAPQVAKGLDAAERAARESPQHRREEWLRRLAVAALAALTLWLHLSNSGKESTSPRQRPPVHTGPARP
ncbi:hypothetical protein [Myxococcus hansupus]|uniref:hypothetical protein n=1 Tax=Pseudomyxococcus hansupus TaxID=1297742 RepID=UPI001D049BB0|nr:hypothetical protein [Myxococcus hansupus]